MEKKQYKIEVDGCDDSTSIQMALNQEEFTLVDSIAGQITATSNYGCMPRMTITLVEEI